MALILLFHNDTKEMVVVLPDATGHVGMVVVERGDDRFVLNEAFATSRVRSDGQTRLERLPEQETRASLERAAAAALPSGEGESATSSWFSLEPAAISMATFGARSEERRVGKECRSRMSASGGKKQHTTTRKTGTTLSEPQVAG